MADREQAIADAREARESHVAWLKWWRHVENCDDPQCAKAAAYHRREYGGTGEWGAEFEARWVAAYDNILACLEGS